MVELQRWLRLTEQETSGEKVLASSPPFFCGSPPPPLDLRQINLRKEETENECKKNKRKKQRGNRKTCRKKNKTQVCMFTFNMIDSSNSWYWFRCYLVSS